MVHFSGDAYSFFEFECNSSTSVRGDLYIVKCININTMLLVYISVPLKVCSIQTATEPCKA